MSFILDSALLKKYDVQGPHYTSYPSASEFSDTFSVEDYLRHIDDSNNFLLPKPLSLAINIPFCDPNCYYCRCDKSSTQKRESAQTYLNFLYQEIELISEHLARDRLVNQIHFGGGTPNYLNCQQFREILGVVASHFHLSYPEVLKISMEIDPRYSTSEETVELINLGFNHISIGIQDYDPGVQAAINRIQNREQVASIIKAAHQSGVDSVSVDLLAGLPLQTRESFANTLKQVVDFGIDRISVHDIDYLPQRTRSQQLVDMSVLPSRGVRIAMMHDAFVFLSGSGYVHLGTGHFALPSDALVKALETQQLKRGFQGYVTYSDCDLVGLGVNAISQIGDAYMQNSSALTGYYASLEKGQLPIRRGISLKQDDLMRADIIQQIMCQHTVNYHEIDVNYEVDFKAYFAEELKQLGGFVDDQLITLRDQQFIVTEQGRFFLRNIARVFDRYLGVVEVGGAVSCSLSLSNAML